MNSLRHASLQMNMRSCHRKCIVSKVVTEISLFKEITWKIRFLLLLVPISATKIIIAYLSPHLIKNIVDIKIQNSITFLLMNVNT